MAPRHARSISMPTMSNPLSLGVEELLNKLKFSQTTTPSTSLAILRELYSQIDDLIHFPLTEDKCMTEVLDGFLIVLDVCDTTREVLSEMKQNVQDLQSSLRRKRGDDFSLADDIAAYKASKMKVIRKCLGVLKRIQNNRCHSSLAGKHQQLVHIIVLLRDVQKVTLSVFGSILSFVSGPKAQSRSVFSKLMHPKQVECKVEDESELETLESRIQELEEGMDGLFRCLIKTKVCQASSDRVMAFTFCQGNACKCFTCT